MFLEEGFVNEYKLLIKVSSKKKDTFATTIGKVQHCYTFDAVINVHLFAIDDLILSQFQM
jgi:hypothetical protein